MAARRALVVDDSKSARVVLSRMLERYGLEVDSAESAEQAFDYLKSNRPDVIFMDHMMPGMDGLQAVQRIKTDTTTAAIPVMMYTSQEGELYVGQARALGAVGVLPKTVRPVDVTKVLYQLRLLPDRRDPSPSVFQPADGARAAAEPGGAPAPTPVAANDGSVAPAAPDLGPQIEKLVHEQTIELRRFFVATLDSSAQRIVTELRPREEEKPPAVELPSPPRPWGWIAAAAAAVLALVVVSFLYWQSLETAREVEAARARLEQESGALRNVLEQVREAVAERNAALAPVAAGGAPVAAGAGLHAGAPAPMTAPADLRVPYGELPLAPARVDALRATLADLQRRGFRGVVRIGLHGGEFCLAESPAGGYVLAEPATPVAKCALVGNPYLDGLNASDRQPLSFANLIDTVKADTRGLISVVLMERGRTDAAVAYPTGDGVLAGDWNRAAFANNRVTVSLDAR